MQNQVELAGEHVIAIQLEAAQPGPEAELATCPPAVALHLTVRGLRVGPAETAECLYFLDFRLFIRRRNAAYLRFCSSVDTEFSTRVTGVHIELSG